MPPLLAYAADAPSCDPADPLTTSAADPRTVHELVTTHLGLAVRAVLDVSARYGLPAHVDTDDLQSAAREALVTAATRFDPGHGAAFASYAVTRVRGAVIDELRRSTWASRSLRTRGRAVAEAIETLQMILGRVPTDTEIADHMRITPDDLRIWRTATAQAVLVSLDARLDVSADGHVALPLPSDLPTPEDTVLRGERHRFLQIAVTSLPGRLPDLVTRHFVHDETLGDIAADYGVTLGRTSQMRQHAVRLLRAAFTQAWSGGTADGAGGVRARREQDAYLETLASRFARTSGTASVSRRDSRPGSRPGGQAWLPEPGIADTGISLVEALLRNAPGAGEYPVLQAAG